MGTNYYTPASGPCDCCGQETTKELHIGKSSAGWCFSLHVIPEMNLNTLDDWKAFLRGKRIYDQYDNFVKYDDLMEIITERSFERHASEIFDDFNGHAELGPNGLLRAKAGIHGVTHGEGTWDYIPGDFS